jgi:CubicO group peptidase (beta-lactamase class C family)
MPTHGFTLPGYEEVEEAFRENFEKQGEIGAACCVYHQHECVVDIWGGYRDIKKKTAWECDTLVPVFSTTKAVAAACLALCHSRGLFQYSDRVANHWEAFGENGKKDITIEQLLQHRAGLSAIDQKLSIQTIANRPLLEEIIARQKPRWTPGQYQGYHVWNIGWYISALLSKIDPKGRRLHEFLKEEILPNMKGDIRIGIDENFDLNRIARLKPFSKLKGLFAMPPAFVAEFFKPWSLTFKSMLNPSFVSDHANFNKPEILQLEIGSGGGIANACGLASLIDALNDPNHVLCLSSSTRDYLEQYPPPPACGYRDIVFKQDVFRFHAGFMKPSGYHDFSRSNRAYGGFGAGGSFVFTDPEQQLTIAYTMNKMDSAMMNIERELNLRKAVYNSITRLGETV